MDQKFLELPQGKLSYYESNATANSTVIFIHGNSGSSAMWSKQFQSRLKNHYRLIAIDLPGHGASFHSKSPEEDYSPIGTAEILSAALNLLVPGRPFILIGFSYGSNVVAEILAYGIKPLGIVLISSCVTGKDHGLEKIFPKTDTPSIFFYNEENPRVVEDWFHTSLFTSEQQDFQNIVRDYLRVNPAFKPALFKTAADGKITDEVSALRQSAIPVCVVFGKKDNVVNVDYLDDLPFCIWNNSIFKLSSAGHWVNLDQPAEVDRIVNDYAKFIFKEVHASRHA